MLDAVNVIHEERIVHSDLKPANFVLIRGTLKLIDFGIAKAIANDTTNIQRDAQVRFSLPSNRILSIPRTDLYPPDRYSQLHESGNHERSTWG